MRKFFSIRPIMGAAAGAILIASAGASLAGQSSVNQGVYTAPQAERGSKMFASKCTTCHDPARFQGPDFIKQWSGQPLHAIFDLMKTTMPEDNPGSLQPQQYADVLAYFLQLNAYPTGAEELAGTDDRMKAIQMDAPKKGSLR